MLGTATEKVNDGNIMPMIVLKKFSCSLDSIIHNPEVYVPPGDNTRTVAEKHIQLAARLASELADGLLYLHENGLVHGNLMPQNILVREHFIHFCIAFIMAFHLIICLALMAEDVQLLKRRRNNICNNSHLTSTVRNLGKWLIFFLHETAIKHCAKRYPHFLRFPPD